MPARAAAARKSNSLYVRDRRHDGAGTRALDGSDLPAAAESASAQVEEDIIIELGHNISTNAGHQEQDSQLTHKQEPVASSSSAAAACDQADSTSDAASSKPRPKALSLGWSKVREKVKQGDVISELAKHPVSLGAVIQDVPLRLSAPVMSRRQPLFACARPVCCHRNDLIKIISAAPTSSRLAGPGLGCPQGSSGCLLMCRRVPGMASRSVLAVLPSTCLGLAPLFDAAKRADAEQDGAAHTAILRRPQLLRGPGCPAQTFCVSTDKMMNRFGVRASHTSRPS